MITHAAARMPQQDAMGYAWIRVTAMQTKRTPVELNESPRAMRSDELRQYLISASNGLYLYELASGQSGHSVPEALKRAHSAIRAEIKRLEAQIPAAARRETGDG